MELEMHSNDYSTVEIKQEPGCDEDTMCGVNKIDDIMLEVKQENDEMEIDRNSDEFIAHEDESTSCSTRETDTEEDLQIKDEITIEEAKVERYTEFDKARLQVCCKFCDFRCGSRSSLLVHVKSAHPEDGITRCRICHFSTKGASQLEKHIEDKHEGFGYKCYICLAKYKKGQYKEHRRQCPGRLLFNCDTCGKSFVKKDGLLKHLDEHGFKEDHKEPTIKEVRIKEKFYTCAICEDHRAYRLDAYEIHQEEHNGHRMRCPDCSALLLSKSSRYRHLNKKLCKRWSIRGKLKCHCCAFRCDTESELRTHLEIHSKRFRCNICHTQFKESSQFEKHIAEEHQGCSFECNVCLTPYRKGQRSLHKRQCTGQLLFSCNSCDKNYVKEERLLKHLDEHGMPQSSNELLYSKIMVKERHFSCVICEDDIAYRKDKYLEHVKNLHNGYHIRCPDCGKIFKRPAQLNAHIQNVCKVGSTREKMIVEELVCPECLISFPNRSARVTHIAEIHGKNPYICNVCQMDFQTDGTLRYHKSIAHREPTLNCSLCTQKFHLKGALRRHMTSEHKITKKKRIFECEKCLKHFNRRDNYNKHMKRHEKRLKERIATSCDVCGIECPSLEAMQSHKIKTHQEPSLCCSYCTEKYHFDRELRRHIEMQHKTVEGKKSNSCNECGMKFTTLGALRYHKVKSHMEPALSCSYCELQFHYKSELHRHIAVQHKNTVSDKRSITIDDGLMDCQTDRALRYHKRMIHMEPTISYSRQHITSENKIIENRKKSIFECEKCLKQFNRRAYYNKHMKRHEKRLKDYQQAATSCDVCGMECPSLEAMRFHKVKTHQEPSLCCSYCTEKYHFDEELCRHLKLQHKNIEEKKSNNCNECGMEFTTLGALRYHKVWIVKNHMEASLSCSYCEQKFHFKSALHRHLAKHNKNTVGDQKSITVDDELTEEVVIKDEITLEENKIQEFTEF